MAGGITKGSQTLEFQDDFIIYHGFAKPDKTIDEMNDYERALKLEHLRIIKKWESETK